MVMAFLEVFSLLLGNAMTRDVDGLTSRDGRVAAVENK
jgi:hypothetical protein